MRVHVCLLARATRAVEGRKSKGEARSGRTGARTESKSLKIGSHALFNDWTTRFFCRGYFFTKQPMPKTYKAMDLSMLHLCAKGRLNSPNFQRRSKGRPKKKKRAKKQIFKNHKKKKNAMIRRPWFWESYCSFGTLMARSSKGKLGPVAFLALRRCVLPCPKAIMVKTACCNE